MTEAVTRDDARRGETGAMAPGPALRGGRTVWRAAGAIATGFGIAAGVHALRLSCRVRWYDDPRPELRRRGEPYLYCVLHAHQLGAIMFSEWGTGAILSASTDGEILVPSLRLRGVTPYRGSSRGPNGADKGGREALTALVRHIRAGGPGYLAVDGPRGPRGEVRPGIAVLARATGAAVLPLCLVPERRWVLTRAWDRFQIPRPGTTIRAYFDEPLRLRADDDIESFRLRVERRLRNLERLHDPDEAAAGEVAAAKRRDRLASQARVHALEPARL